MKGDFSQWRINPLKNYNGVLQQQGRVFLDSDWNDETQIRDAWQETAGRDIIGSGVAAIPAEDKDGFKIESALVNGENQVELTVHPGRAWVNGRLVHFEEINDNKRIATFLKDPSDVISNLTGIRDAVVLEVWREEVNAFQVEDLSDNKRLLEPALGGPDTTERIYTSAAFRLLRLQENEGCPEVKQRLMQEFSLPGRLSVTLEPVEVEEGECPTLEDGGYTGFEHNLYRIEVAQVNPAVADAMFKWSQYNGGLVGRGVLETIGGSTTITINANLAAINSARLTTFYLEVVAFDQELGYFRVTYGAEVTLDSNVLTVKNDKRWYTPDPQPVGEVFFRLWNGIEYMSNFPAPSGSDDPTHFRDGIRLVFHSTSKADYKAQDYWTFAVRSFIPQANDVLIDNEPPHGVVYQRVPLAILNWNAAKNISYENGGIDDCRRIFRSLINQKICCSFFVGDGINSQGDFNSLSEALKHLPEEGGRICLLPGVHMANVEIRNRNKIRITGCSEQTIVNPHQEKAKEPIFTIIDSSSIQIDHLTIINRYGSAIRMFKDKTDQGGALSDIEISENRIASYMTAIYISGGQNIAIEKNHITLFNLQKGGRGIYAQGSDIIIAYNRIITVLSPADSGTPDDTGTGEDDGGGYFEFCRDVKNDDYGSFGYRAMVVYMFAFQFREKAILGGFTFETSGGMQIGPGSDNVCVRYNEISGGSEDGITFGRLPLDETAAGGEDELYIINALSSRQKKEYEKSFAGFIYNLSIENNDIRYMGRNGIGVAAIFDLKKVGFFYSLNNCAISQNHIAYCALQLPKLTENDLRSSRYLAFGGIILTFAEDIIIRENRIENNGRSHLQPVCGIFIYYSENVDISDNRIINNGPRTTLDDDAAVTGWRGGIVLPYNKKSDQNKIGTTGTEADSEAAAAAARLAVEEAKEKIVSGEAGATGAHRMIINHNMSSIREGRFSAETGLQELSLPLSDGIPAAKLHDNIVVQPLGQALFLQCMGPVSVLSNHFTSQGVLLDAASASMRGMAVVISNHGVARDFNSQAAIGSIRQGMKQTVLMLMNSGGEDKSRLSSGMRMAVNSNLDSLTLGQLAYLPSGTVLFSDNRVTLQIPSSKLKAINTGLLANFQVNNHYSSIMIDSRRDDIAFTDNQVECLTLSAVISINAILAGFSVRALNNRLQDGIVGIVNSLFAQANYLTIIGNQATHCIIPNTVPATMTGKWYIDANAVINPENCLLSGQEYQDTVQVAAEGSSQSVLQLLG